MRCLLAGICFLLLFPVAAPAQFKGEVQSIGFQSYYRPNCFVPMLVRIQSEKSGTYQIQVVQEDLDRDHQIFAQTVSLTGSEDGRSVEQRFWMYFMPQPGDGGLLDTTRGGTLRELQQQLKVFLCDEKGTRQLAQLTVTSPIQNIENYSGSNHYPTPRGNRLILAVTDSAVQPVYNDYAKAIGTLEDVIFVVVRSTDLPEDVRGFDMIDGMIWLTAPVPDPRRPSDEKRYRAIEEWVRGGGHLVVCQPAQREAIAPIASWLPVEVQETAPRNDLEPLRTLATEHLRNQPPPREDDRRRPAVGDPLEDPLPKERGDDWRLPTGPYMFARATLKPRAIVAPDAMLKWDDAGKDQTPYIARHGLGLGCVTWVAHDLSDPAIVSRAKSGWPYVWDKVLDYRNDLTVTDDDNSRARSLYSQMPAVDVSNPLLARMQLTSKSRALVAIAVVFFIAYWAIAGPGVYFFLLTRSRTQMSWFMFGASAIVATFLTVLVVRLVVRGDPEIAHVTVVRGAAGSPQISVSRFGLYIPRDGSQQIALPEVQPRQVSYVIADPKHPKDAIGDIDFPAQEQYFIPINDSSEDGPVKISVPFRSTAKEFQTRRVGPTGGAIDGGAKLRETEAGYRLEGKVTNGTGNRLKNVYVVYFDPRKNDDVIFFIPKMEKSESLDLRDLDEGELRWLTHKESLAKSGQPHENVRLWGILGKSTGFPDWAWARYFYSAAPTSVINEMAYGDLSRSLPMMSLFKRLPPVRNGWRNEQVPRDRRGLPAPDRFDVVRRGGRHLDVSNVVAAGELLVLAEAAEPVAPARNSQATWTEAPLPYPLEVAGDKIEGKGVVYYQFAIPTERIALPPSTQPATTEPTTAVKLGTPPAVTAMLEGN